jgi:hypothetical protein
MSDSISNDSKTPDVIHTPTHDIADNIPTIKLFYGENSVEVPENMCIPWTESPLDAFRGRGLPGVNEIKSIAEGVMNEEPCPCKSAECKSDEDDRKIKQSLLVLQQSHIGISQILGDDEDLWDRFRKVVVEIDKPDATIAGVLFSTAKRSRCLCSSASLPAQNGR